MWLSTKNLLIVSPIKDAQRAQFAATGVNLVELDDLNHRVAPSAINIMYGWKAAIGEQLLAAPQSQLEWVHAISAGVDSLPLATLAQRGIKLTNAAGIHAQAISQSVLASILYFVRGLDIASHNQQRQHWAHHDDQTPHVIDDFKYVIFGTGHIGQQIARLLKSFGGYTIGVNTTGHPAEYFDDTISIQSLDSRVWQADVVVNVMPLTDTTHHFFNHELFDQFTHLFLFVNVGRGPVVDSTSVIDGINSGLIQHAALDVFETEPLPADSPFWHLPNTLITPHNTGVITHFKKAQAALLLPNLKQYLTDGTFKTNQVDLTKGY